MREDKWELSTKIILAVIAAASTIAVAYFGYLGVTAARGTTPTSTAPIATAASATDPTANGSPPARGLPVAISSFSVAGSGTGEDVSLRGTGDAGVLLYAMARRHGTNTWWTSDRVTVDGTGHWTAIIHVPVSGVPLDASATLAPGGYGGGPGDPTASYLDQLHQQGPPAGQGTAPIIGIG